MLWVAQPGTGNKQTAGIDRDTDRETIGGGESVEQYCRICGPGPRWLRGRTNNWQAEDTHHYKSTD